MKLDSDKFFVDESKSNPMQVAVCYPDCPLPEKGVCANMVVGFGTLAHKCSHLKMKDMNDKNVECNIKVIE